MAKIGKGAVVEFDFAVLNGADLLFDIASGVLKGHGVALDARLEALHLAGGNYQGALAELFAQATDMNVDRMRIRSRVVSPDVVHKLLARKDLSGV